MPQPIDFTAVPLGQVRDHLMACAVEDTGGWHLRVAIVGSRDFPHQSWVRFYVLGLPAGATVITGGARGVDTWAEEVARGRKLGVEIFPADWQEHGRAAGPIRNRQIVEAADLVVAFWDGKSRGTASTLALARAAKKKVAIYAPQEPTVVGRHRLARRST